MLAKRVHQTRPEVLRMDTRKGRLAPRIYAILRVVSGLMFMMHGTQKLFAWPGTKPRATAALQFAAGVIETAGGLMIALGLFASFAAFIASGTMAVAYFMRHAGTGEKFYPLINRGELAVLYCFLLLFIAAAGSGMWSLDALRRRKTATRDDARTNDDAGMDAPQDALHSDDAPHLPVAISRPWTGRFTMPAFTVLRIMAGVMFAMHGSQKLVGWPGHQPPVATFQMRLAGTIELAGGVMIALGFVAAVAAFFASGLMAAAYFMSHAPKGLFLPILNGGELAVLYCFLWLYLAAAGPGRWSIDALRGRGGTPGEVDAGDPHVV